MTEEVWSALLSCIVAAENSDNSMSGWLTKEAQIASEWLHQQEWDEE